MLSRRLAEVTGTLFDAAGRPTPDYFVVVFSTNRDHWIEGSRRVPPPVRPSTNGTYKVATLPAGSYYLAALTDVDPEELFDRAFLEQVAAGAMTITLSEGFSLLTKLMAAFWMSSRRNSVEPLVSMSKTTLNGESVVAK